MSESAGAAAGAAQGKKLMVRCPSCGQPHEYKTDNPYRPFCSKGCKAIDLGAWASEQYRVQAKQDMDGDVDDSGA